MPPPVCQFCGQPATVHLTDIVQKVKKESHLCEACARAKELLPDPVGGHLNLQALVSLVLGAPPSNQPVALICPACGLQYTEFRKHGRLGCPADYAAFRPALEPLLDKIHRATAHAGKAPRTAGAGGGAKRSELADLRERLRVAVAAERYEEAAVLRDTIREKEGADETR
jgi:protein arginine kinase activator